MICNHRVLHMNPRSKSSNLSHFNVISEPSLGMALRQCITAVRGNPSAMFLHPPPPTHTLSCCCYRMVKIAPSLIESKHGEVIELGLFL